MSEDHRSVTERNLYLLIYLWGAETLLCTIRKEFRTTVLCILEQTNNNTNTCSLFKTTSQLNMHLFGNVQTCKLLTERPQQRFEVVDEVLLDLRMWFKIQLAQS